RKLAGGPLLKKHFEKHPLHTLKEDTFKQSLTKMMLKSVSVKKGVLIVELAVF
ncbi:MAG: DUF1439 domain-containing protein, partial [Desulfobacterales bacterium]|nr:DUF1439 domain-containing protein [Desulfobacterales bacterium]